jgi:hypothetical protein
MMDNTTIIGIWIAGFLTLAIFSFLFKDNPFYKFAEYLYVGVSAGYWMVLDYQNVLVPNLFDKLKSAGQAWYSRQFFSPDWIYLIPAFLGLLLLLRIIPKISWVSRLPLAFSVGIFAGINIVYNMQAQVLEQIKATILPLWINGNLSQSLLNILIVTGVCCTLIYFYFSLEHKSWFMKSTSRAGIIVLMISFGAGFGYTVMGRVSILIDRMLFFREQWWPAVLQTLKHLTMH